MPYGFHVHVRGVLCGYISIGNGELEFVTRFDNIGTCFIGFGLLSKKLPSMLYDLAQGFSSNGPVDVLIGGNQEC